MAMPVKLATGGFDHKIRFWDATSGYASKTIQFGESQVNCLQISPDKKVLVAGGNPTIHVYDVNSSEEKPIIVYKGHTNNGEHTHLLRILSCVSCLYGPIQVWCSSVSSFWFVYITKRKTNAKYLLHRRLRHVCVLWAKDEVFIINFFIWSSNQNCKF